LPDSDARGGSGGSVEVDVGLLGIEARRVPFNWQRLERVDGLLTRGCFVEPASLACCPSAPCQPST
jgi:hypothetical protein